MRFHIALDSGAHSIYNRFVEAKTKGSIAGESISFRANRAFNAKVEGYTNTKQFRDYFDSYAAYVSANKNLFDFCVALDIIYNPKRTYEVWLDLEKQGVHTLPVLHYGEDAVWLKKYMDHTDYLGIGGMGQGISDKDAYGLWAARVFKLLADKHGRPQWKTHGFAMTSTSLMRKFPWTSVDSSSVFYHARMGNIVVPRTGPGSTRDYLRELAICSMTPRRTKSRSSYLNTDPLWRAHVTAYLHELGFDSIEGLGETHVGRDASNVVTYCRVAQAISAERSDKLPPLKLYISGHLGTGHSDLFMETVGRINALGVSDFYYMGTHFLPQPTQYLLEKGLCKGQLYEHENKRPTLRLEARPTLRRRG